MFCFYCLLLVFPNVSFFVFLVSRMFSFLLTFGKTKNKQNTKRKTYPRVGLKPLKLWLFGCPGVVVGFLWFSFAFWVFPKVFKQPTKTFGKTQKHNKTKTYPRVGLKPFKHFVVFLLSLICFGFSLVFFGIVGVPYVFVVCCFNFRENNNTKRRKTTNPYPRVVWNLYKLSGFWFSRWCCLFSLVFFCIVGFPEYLFCFLKTSGKTKQNKK